jgi:predicted nucleic acid-binding protein
MSSPKTWHMVAASNTSPISNLALIGRLDLLRIQFQEVWIPDAVQRELHLLPVSDGRASIQQAMDAGWLRRRSIANRALVAVLVTDLDQGEAEAIALATEISADVLLIDERDGRARARQAGVVVRGVLGVLIRAKAMGLVSSMKDEIRSLRAVAKFFIAPSLEEEVLRSVGE